MSKVRNERVVNLTVDFQKGTKFENFREIVDRILYTTYW